MKWQECQKSKQWYWLFFVFLQRCIFPDGQPMVWFASLPLLCLILNLFSLIWFNLISFYTDTFCVSLILLAERALCLVWLPKWILSILFCTRIHISKEIKLWWKFRSRRNQWNYVFLLRITSICSFTSYDPYLSYDISHGCTVINDSFIENILPRNFINKFTWHSHVCLTQGNTSSSLLSMQLSNGYDSDTGENTGE